MMFLPPPLENWKTGKLEITQRRNPEPEMAASAVSTEFAKFSMFYIFIKFFKYSVFQCAGHFKLTLQKHHLFSHWRP